MLGAPEWTDVLRLEPRLRSAGLGSSPAYLDPVVLAYITGSTVLDVGCGIGRWGNLIASNYWEAEGAPEEPPAVDGFDAFEPNVEHCSALGTYRKVWHQVLPSPLEGKWDTVLASEVIEHVPPESVNEVLDILEGAADRRVILTTPNWHYLRPGTENPYEAHLGSVGRKELAARGYRLRGAGIKYRPSPVVSVMSRLKIAWVLESLPRAFPRLGDLIVAVKDVSRSS